MSASRQEEEQVKFDHEVFELINSGAMADKGGSLSGWRMRLNSI
jgi:hypothetical protein